MRRNSLLATCTAAILFVGCREATTTHDLGTPSFSALGAGSVLVVNVSRDTTAQNETPLAVNPANPGNMITGNNDWNYNDGCGVNATFDGGKTWTPTLPSGFIPGITAFTNDPSVPGTGADDFGGDPAVAFSPDGGTAYFTCFGYKGKNVALWLSRSSDGGRTWTAGGPDHPLTLVSAFQGEGKARGSNGQFPDHESITVANDGTIYVPWAHFTGFSAHSPIFIAVSHDGGNSFDLPVKVSSGSVRNDQDARVVVDPATGYAYLTFDSYMEQIVQVRHIPKPRLPLPAVLLQHLRRPVPRSWVVPRARIRPDDRPPVRGLHRHRK